MTLLAPLQGFYRLFWRHSDLPIRAATQRSRWIYHSKLHYPYNTLNMGLQALFMPKSGTERIYTYAGDVH